MTATSENASAETISSGFAKARELNENMLTQSSKFNAQVSTNYLKFTQEWSEFAGMRLREDMQLIQTIQGCRSLPELQQAYAQYWQNTLAQYGEETRRMLRITQETVDDASQRPLENGAAKVTLHKAD
jgi:Phasin protein